MPDDLLPSAEPAAPVHQPKHCICEFCECTLVPSGEVLKMGAKARSFRDIGERLEIAKADLTKARDRVAQLEAEIGELKARPAAAATAAGSDW